MAPKLVKTSTPGIYRRHAKSCPRVGRCGCSYVVVYGNKADSFATLDDAREGKRLAQRQAKLARGHLQGLHRDQPRDECPECARELHERGSSDPLLRAYARGWVDRYHGTGRRGFRDESRDEYRQLLEKYALTFFPESTRLRTDVGPSAIAGFVGWLVKQPNGRGGSLSDKSVRNALGPLRACLASAKREGLIPDNPAVGAALPHRPRVQEDEDLPRPFPSIELDGELVETMELVVSLVHPGHRVMFELLAATGVRRSELIAFAVRHLALDGDQPQVKIRQRARWQKGRGRVIGPLKSGHARRDLPISVELADRLRSIIVGRAAEELVFASPMGGVYDPAHLDHRVLAPACSEAGVEWAGFHTFRHTVASRMFHAGRTAVQVQHWLGHHSAAFTLSTYVHLLKPGDLGGPLEPVRVKKRSSERPEIAVSRSAQNTAETSSLQA